MASRNGLAGPGGSNPLRISYFQACRLHAKPGGHRIGIGRFCFFLASLKTLLISTKAICLTPKSTSRASFSLAGFQLTLIGRFWVIPEDSRNAILRKRILAAFAL